MNEIWENIKGYNGDYLASTKGRIKSLKGLSERILKQSLKMNGYLSVDLSDPVNGTKTKTVHGLVCEAFLGERPSGYQVDHVDGNKQNNFLTNLRYVTISVNNHTKKSLVGSFRGVYKNDSGSYYSQISINGANNHLGCFKKKKNALIAYNKAAKKYYGKDAVLNNLEGII